MLLKITTACFISLLFSTHILFAASVDHVIVISIDGGKPSVMAKSEMPNLNRLTADGSSTFAARTVFPSKTLPSHTSMLTGVTPKIHKIDWNNWNPLKGTVKVPTVHGLLKAQGYSTALFATKTKFRHLKVKNSYNEFSLKADNAIESAKLAAAYFAAKKPNFLFVHMPDADVAGHASGWGSTAQMKALKNVDAAIKIIEDTVLKNTKDKKFVVIITADHGGSGLNHGSASDDDTVIPWIVWGNVVKKNYHITEAVSTLDTTATVLWLFGVNGPQNLQGQPQKNSFLLN